MSVAIHEGLPGSGKTLRMLSLIEGFLEQKRSVYLFNFKLSDKGTAYFTALAEKHGVGFYLRTERPADLHVDLDVDPNTGYVSLQCLGIQDGSTLVFDEAQEYFKSRGMSKEPTPAFVAMLPTHRHSGYNIHFITQNVMYLDIEIRRICDSYTKYSRLMNWDRCRLDVYGGVKDNPMQQSQVLLERGQTFRYPKHLFELYTSSVDHNMKSRFPSRLKWLIILIFVILGLFYAIYYFWTSMMGSITGSSHHVTKPIASPVPSSSPSTGNVPSSPASSSPAVATSPHFNRNSAPKSDPVETYLGIGRPSVPDITDYDIYYSGYYAEFNPSGVDKQFKRNAIPVFNLLHSDGTCSRVTDKFFKALNLSLVFDREFAIIYNSKEKIRHVLPVTASPCVNQYVASNNTQSEGTANPGRGILSSSSSNSQVNSRPVHPIKSSKPVDSPRLGDHYSSSYAFPNNPDSVPQ
jgi:hypothetical protein